MGGMTGIMTISDPFPGLYRTITGKTEPYIPCWTYIAAASYA